MTVVKTWQIIAFSLVIKHIHRRIWEKDSNGHFIYNSNFTLAYYHPLLSHILRKHPYFDGRVQINISLLENLLLATLYHLLQCHSWKSFLLPNSNFFSKIYIKKNLLKDFKESRKTFFNFVNIFMFFICFICFFLCFITEISYCSFTFSIFVRIYLDINILFLTFGFCTHHSLFRSLFPISVKSTNKLWALNFFALLT